MTKKEILDYVAHTPHNTNKMVLSSMLDSYDSDKISCNPQDLSKEQQQQARQNIDAIGREEIFGTVVEATPETLYQIIENAKPNTTIRLVDGDYEEIDLCGYNSFPENLTILGGQWDTTMARGAKVSGIHIHSGLSQAEYWTNSDIRQSVLPKGLTLMNLYLVKDCVVENCQIEDLTISGCYFGRGAKITVSPNGINYNKSGRYSHANVKAKNVLIRGCRFVETINATSASCILVLDTDGVTIYNNSIENTSYYGVQVSHKADRKFGTGDIKITGNRFLNCSSRGIRISYIKDGDLAIVGNNITKPEGAKADQIAISNCKNTSYVFKTGEGGNGNSNICNSEPATVENGIISLNQME